MDTKGVHTHFFGVLCIKEHPTGVVGAPLMSAITTPPYICSKIGVSNQHLNFNSAGVDL